MARDWGIVALEGDYEASEAERRVLVRMALGASDNDGAPMYFGGRDALARAAYKGQLAPEGSPARRDQYRYVRRLLRQLGDRGLVEHLNMSDPRVRTVLASYPKVRAVYVLHLDGLRQEGPQKSLVVPDGQEGLQQVPPDVSAGGTKPAGRRDPQRSPRLKTDLKDPSGGADADATAHTDGDSQLNTWRGRGCPSGTKKIITGWLAAVPRPPKHVIDQIARHVQQMLEVDKIPADHIAQGLTEWSARGHQPNSLPSFVYDISSQPPPAGDDPHEPRCCYCNEPMTRCIKINSKPGIPDRHDFQPKVTGRTASDARALEAQDA